MSQIQPLVSIVIPNYNNARFLPQCLESCIHQSYCNLEIIVVDDCSSDESVQIIEGYAAKDSRIRLIQNETNQKVSRTRDRGIRTAKAEWITTLDSDDFYITKDKIKREVEIVRKCDFNPNTIAYSGVQFSSLRNITYHTYLSKKNANEGQLVTELITRSIPIPRDYLFAKSAYLRVGGIDLDIKLWEDWDITILLSKITRFYYAGDHGVAYRQNALGLSSADKLVQWKWIDRIFEKHKTSLSDPRLSYDQLRNSFYLPVLQRIKLSILRRIIF